MNENPDVVRAYKRLAARIVLDAAREYRRTFKRYLKHGKDRRKLGYEGRKSLDSCTRFFESKWCDCLTEYKGRTIKKKIEERCYKELGIEIPK